MKRGLVLCHGLNHDPLNLDSTIRWTYLDPDPDADPDVFGFVGQQDLTKFLGSHRYSIVWNENCPFYGNVSEFIKFCHAIQNLLTSDGYLVTADVYDHWNNLALHRYRYLTQDMNLTWNDFVFDSRFSDKFDNYGGYEFLTQSKSNFYKSLAKASGFKRALISRDGREDVSLIRWYVN